MKALDTQIILKNCPDTVLRVENSREIVIVVMVVLLVVALYLVWKRK